MIPFRLNQKQFQERYAQCLDRLSSACIAELRTLLARPLPDDVKLADVQLFPGDDDPFIPAVWIYFQGDNNRVDKSDTGIFPGRSLELALGLESVEEFDERYYTNEKFDGLNLRAGVLKSWFAECWWKAGGWVYPLPVSLYVHDGDGKGIRLSELAGKKR